MKHALKLVIVAGFVAMMGSCVNSLEMAIPNNHEATNADAVTTAIDYFNTHARGLLTRVADQEPTPEAPYLVGNLIPDWDSSVTIANEQKSYTDFEMQKDYRYYLVLERNADTLRGLQLYSRFVSVIDYEIDTLSQYVATYIPAADYVDSYVNEYGEIDCSAWGDFSGVVLYTMLSGHHVAAYSYDNGELTGQSFLYNPDQSPEENTTDFLSVMNGMELFVLPAEEETRSSLPSHIQFIYVEVREDNTIISHQYLLLDDDNSSLLDDDYTTPSTGPIEIVEPIVLPSTGGGGGGQTTTNTQESPTHLAKNFMKKVSISNTYSGMLESSVVTIIKDCMGGELIKQLTDLLGENELQITYDQDSDDSIYSYKSDSIVLNIYDIDVLLHELFHVYQYKTIKSQHPDLSPQEIATLFESANANYEVEAQIAKYMFSHRLYGEIVDDKVEYRQGYVGYGVTLAYKKLTSKGYVINEQFGDLFEVLCKIYVEDSKQKQKKGIPCIDYRFNSYYSTQKNTINITTLSGNC